MHDQAATLRQIAALPVSDRPTSPARTSRTIAITGGKGGVGKSNLAVNLALLIGSHRKKVVLLDADFALANADLLCGVRPNFHLGHVVNGQKRIDEICIKLTDSVRLIPGGSGIEGMSNFSLSSKPHVQQQIRELEDGLDFMIVDTAAGIADNVADVLAASNEVVVVVTPDPTSIIDGYATIKVILRRNPAKPISVVVNDVVAMGEADRVFKSISTAVSGFLDRRPKFLGMVPHDPQVQEAIRRQVPVSQFAKDSPASRAIGIIAKEIATGEGPATSGAHAAQNFWDLLSAN